MTVYVGRERKWTCYKDVVEIEVSQSSLGLFRAATRKGIDLDWIAIPLTSGITFQILP